MNRLWIRFSVIISSLSLVIIMLWVVIERIDLVISRDGFSFDSDLRLYALPGELAETMVLVSTIAVILGVLLSRGLSAPIVALSKAAREIGSGDLQQRVPVNNHSQELDDLARSFNRMAADLENAETLRKNMLADISHELRTPLTALSGQLRGVLDHVYELDEAEIANLYGQTEHLIRLVEDLHLLAQAEARQLPLHKTAVSLTELWQEITLNFTPLAAEKDVHFTTSLPANLPAITADPIRLRQIFTNLLANALRHTPSGGRITVQVSHQAGIVTLTIADDGDGIAPEHLPHLFDRFYRTDRSRNRETGGTGLGLAIVKALVEEHGGKITAVSSGIGQGSMFTLSFPTT